MDSMWQRRRAPAVSSSQEEPSEANSDEQDNAVAKSMTALARKDNANTCGKELDLYKLYPPLALCKSLQPYSQTAFHKPQSMCVSIAKMRCFRHHSSDELRLIFYQGLRKEKITLPEVESAMKRAERLQDAMVCGTNYETVEEILHDIAPECQFCHKPQQFFCLEECCIGSTLFCSECESTTHFLHRTNSLSVLFLNRKVLTNFNGKLKETAIEVTNSLRLQIQFCNKVILDQQKLISALEADIDQLSKLRDGCDPYWHDGAYRTLELYVTQQLQLQDARRIFGDYISSLNVHLKLSDFWKGPILSYEAAETAALSMTEQMNSMNLLRKTVSSLTQEKVQIQTCEQLARATPHQHPTDCLKIHLPEAALHNKFRSVATDVAHIRRPVLASRLQVGSSGCSPIGFRMASCPHEQLRELTVKCPVRSVPDQLISLAVDLRRADSWTVPEQLEFPDSLLRLSISVSPKTKKLPLQLQHLVRLKWLTLRGMLIDINTLKGLLLLGISNGMHLLYIEKAHFPSTPYLLEHAVSYRRKLLQLVAMARTRGIRNMSSLFLQGMLSATETAFEVKLENLSNV